MSDHVCTPEHEDASFCSGPSNHNPNPFSPEDPSSDIGVTQGEIDYCVENYPDTYPDEHTGECTKEALEFEIELNNEPEGTTTEVPVSPAPAETLPETGIADFSGLALVGASLIAMGGMILRRT